MVVIRAWTWATSLFGFVLLAAPGDPARAQAPLADAPGASAPSTAASKPATTVEQLAERLRAMEEMNQNLARELESTKREHQEQMGRILERFEALQARPDADGLEPEPAEPDIGEAPSSNGDGRDDVSFDPVPDYTEGQFAPFTPAPGYRSSDIKSGGKRALRGVFGPGFQFQTKDEEYRLQIHYESQIEARIWSQSDQTPANSGIFLPRQRIFFSGNITKPVEYELAVNRGSGGTFNLLNAFINLHFNDRFQFRFGRFFTPLPYDQYAISNYWLPTPERSLFTTNLSLNRQFGLMAWGYLFDKRLDYAAGVFNGSRNSFESLDNGVDFVAYFNARPFQQSEALEFARFLNVGSSVAFGRQDQSPVPLSFRIGGGSPNTDSPGAGTTPFLILNRDVVERGDRLLGSVHAAYFNRGLSLIGEWQYGYGSYASAARPSGDPVPFSGFYVTGGYFLTGEHVEQRSRLYPKRPLIPTKKGGARGIGAWELVARASELRLGEQIFSSGFADPNLWSNRAATTEVGVNWYWNEYMKIYGFWLHGEFGDPVLYRPGGLQKSADMFWLRFQLYF
ncbi:porin [Planctomyces sp. SH-PL62]|uniref:porin n=1 Tax=Planctomyces sp. SH-PL62 TaxID=1636152 RepID=UPI00078B2F0D|nr:porin [Planctomyces sp. SH-PL62]AMV38285.1 Phosphate-selective porin O and P [Planctomyces sp. SH-PL62]